MWTIQEVTLSLPERIIVRCGEHTFPWQPFLGIVTVLRDAEYPWKGWKRAMGLQQSLWSYLSVKRYPWARELMRDGLQKDPHMFSILQGARKKCSGDPKDKIFALYGLFQELGIPMPTPDYRKPVGQVYKEATAACIDYDRSLQILYHASSDLRREDLSSWVPDYSNPGWEDSDARDALMGIHFAAGGSVPSRWRLSSDGANLAIQGKILSSIVSRAEPWMGDDELVRATQNGQLLPIIGEKRTQFLDFCYYGCLVFRSWIRLRPSSEASDYPTGGSSREALRRTLVIDHPGVLADEAAPRNFKHWYDVLTDERLDSESLVHVLMGGPGIRFHHIAMSFSMKKCLFYTESGLMGVAPDPLPVVVEPGDKIAVVPGLEMPLLLRQAPGGYRLLTHVYVHGIMYGEGLGPDGHDTEEIVLV